MNMKPHIILAIFAASASLIWTACNKTESASPKTGPSGGGRTHQLYLVRSQAVGNVLRLPAQLHPYESVNIYPRVSGFIKTVPVDIGSHVREGDVLMEMEAPDIEQNTLAGYERYLKAAAASSASRDNYDRLVTASRTAGAVSPKDLEAAHDRFLADSALCNSERASWKALESMKDYLLVRAPFGGVITQRNIHPGALVTVGGKSDGPPLLELQQISRLRLQVKVPETFAPQLAVSQKVSFTVEALPGRIFTGVISRTADALDDKYRSESVELDVNNRDRLFMPGMYAEVLLPLEGHPNACVVPQTSVLTSTERKYVIRVHGHTANLVDVRTGNENNGMIEIFGGISPRDTILARAEEDIRPDQHIEY